MKHTKVSALKAGILEDYDPEEDKEQRSQARFHKRCPGWLSSPTDQGWGEETIEPDAPTTPPVPIPPRTWTYCTRCKQQEQNFQDTSEHSLRTRVGLDDTSFFERTESKCPVPYKFESYLLNTGLEVAQQIMFYEYRIHWPRTHRAMFPDHHREVSHGRFDGDGSDLERLDVFQTQDARSCRCPINEARVAEREIIDLRNRVCHPRACYTTETIDEYLRPVLRLAVVFQDEKRAFRIAKFRQDLRNLRVHPATCAHRILDREPP